MLLALLRWMIALAWLGLMALLLALPAVGFCLGVTQPPAMPVGWKPPVAHADGLATVAGLGRRQDVGRVLWVDLRGTPVELGESMGLLLYDRIGGLESDLVTTLQDRVPLFAGRHLLLGLVGLNNRTLADHFTANELLEIRAATAAPDPVLDPWRCLGPGYQRAVHYHALHDVSQYLIDNPLVRPIQVGCSAFAVGGAHTTDGHLVVGRLFDFEGGPRFDLDKVVFTMHPAGGLRFVHVAWAGMTGAVTGLNEAGLWVSINAAATADQGFVGRPIVMVVREVLQTCRSIDEAVAVLRRSQVFVSDGVLLASASERRAVVAELGPTGLGVRAWQDDRIISTNHFLDPAWAGDKRNASRMVHGTTAVRAARLTELLDQQPVDPARAVAILRDRRGPGGLELGFNNRSAINAWIGAHLAVADLDRGILWVSEPRHGLGAMRAFTIDGPLPAADLPEDPELGRCLEALPRWLEVRATLLGNVRDPAKRAALVAKLLRLNGDHFESHWIAGLNATDPAARRAHLEEALRLRPAYPQDAEAIRKALGGAAIEPGDPPAAP